MASNIVATAIVCCSLATLFVALRIYTRLRINRSIGWDDYAALITLPFCIVHGVVLSIATRYGAGLHTRDFSMNLKEQYSRWTFVSVFFYLPSLLGYKISILFLYLRIFNVDNNFRYCTWLVMFITFGYLFSNFWTQLFMCRPIIKYWKLEIPGHCISYYNADHSYGSLNFITDLMILVLPLPLIWRIQLSLKEKFEVSVIFFLGSL